MANILDYLDWRGDLSFEADPFHEIDNLIFAELAYVEYDCIFRKTDFNVFFSVKELYNRYLPYAENRLKRQNDPFPILEKAASTARYRDIRAGFYTNILNANNTVQFSAITFILPDGTFCVAYRGTDSTFIGWREDFNLSYMNNAPSQVLAKEYLNMAAEKLPGQIRTVGHSKGGNLAVYASIHAEKEVKDRIIEVYSNDGPGFLKPVVESDAFMEMTPKFRSFIPEESIIGTLLANLNDPVIVQSNSSGANQHNPLNWNILGNRFVRAEKRSSGSILVDDTIRGWLEDCSDEERHTFVTNVFNAIDSAGASNIGDFKKNAWKNSSAVFRAILSLKPAVQKQLFETVQKLAKSGGYVISEEIQKEINRSEFLSIFRKADADTTKQD